MNILEEAEYEDKGDGGFEQERLIQSKHFHFTWKICSQAEGYLDLAFENLRIFRPRLLIAGQPGLGQNFVGAAILHHLEGFHVQSLDFATLVGDSARVGSA